MEALLVLEGSLVVFGSECRSALFQCLAEVGLVLRHPEGGCFVAPSPAVLRIGD